MASWRSAQQRDGQLAPESTRQASAEATMPPFQDFFWSRFFGCWWRLPCPVGCSTGSWPATCLTARTNRSQASGTSSMSSIFGRGFSDFMAKGNTGPAIASSPHILRRWLNCPINEGSGWHPTPQRLANRLSRARRYPLFMSAIGSRPGTASSGGSTACSRSLTTTSQLSARTARRSSTRRSDA